MFRHFNEDKKRIVSNFFSLWSIDIANYVLPLIAIPYLVRVLGPGKYGLVAFAQAFIQYFAMLTDYGFNLSATRNISVSREDPEKISKIFWSVTFIKLGFMVLSLTILVLVTLTFSKFRPDIMLYIFAFGLIIGNVLFPAWFFQGMERMKFIAALNFTAKLIFLIAIFIFVRKESDYLNVAFFTSLGSIIAGIASMWIIFTRFKVKPILPSFHEIMTELKEGWNIFISMASVSLYTTSNTFFLGLFTSNEVVGFFAAGEKIITLIYRLFNPLLVAVYPHISKLAVKSRDVTVRNLRKLFVVILFSSFAVFLVLLVFSRNVVMIVLGSKYASSVEIVRILSPLAFIVPVAYIFANLALLPFKLDKYFARIYIFGGVFNTILLLVLLYFLKAGAAGAAISALITQMTITFLMYFILKKNNINIANFDVASLLAVFEKKAVIEN